MLDKTTDNQLNVNNAPFDKIKEDYDRKMEELVGKYKEEQANHEKLKTDLVKLKQNYESQLNQKKGKMISCLRTN